MFCFLFGTEKRLHEQTLQSTFFWVLKGKSQLNPGFLSFMNWTHPWTSKEHRNGFLWDQSRSIFLNSQFLLYALMSFMRSCLWFKFFHHSFHEDQWAKYGCNKKRSKNTIFEDHIQWWAKTSNTYQRNQKHRKWKRNKTCIYIIRFSKTTLWPFNVHSNQQTTNNQQHPKTSRKDRNKSMKVEKNPKHTPIIPEITPLGFASIKVLSFSSSCRTRSSVTNHKHVIFPITQ